MKSGELKTVQVLVKADVHGSAEALRDSLTKLSNDEVQVKVISAGVGGITESDVNLAAASNAFVIGFNVRADGAARNAIKESGVEVRYYSIIYEAIEDVESAVTGMLAPEIREQIVGLAEVRDVFRSPKLGNIAGCLVMEGFVKRSNPIRVLRDDTVIYEGELESLRRFKDDVNEVQVRYRMRYRREELRRRQSRRSDRVLRAHRSSSNGSITSKAARFKPCPGTFPAAAGSKIRSSAS